MTANPTNITLRRILLGAGFLLAAFATDAFADTVTWTEALGGAWEDGANWDSGSPPTNADFVHAPMAVDISSTGADNQAYELFNSSTLGVSDGQLGVVGTITNDGAITVSGGAAVQAGRVQIDGGNMTITGAGSELAVAQGIFNDAGTVTAVDGARISAESIDNHIDFGASSGGQISANSLVNWTGAEFTIANTGSRVDIHGAITNDGIMAISDAGVVTAHSIDNTESLTLQSGAGLESQSMINHAGATFSVSGSGTSATISGGDTTNHATIAVDTGGVLHVDALDNDGSLSVQGASSVTAGSINNHAAGIVDVAGTGSSLAVTNVIENAATIKVAANGIIATGGYHQQSGLTQVDGALLLSPNDMVFDGGTLAATGTLAANKVWINNGATISPGVGVNNAATLNVIGDLLLQGTSLFEIGGLGQYDLISVTGATSLGGTLDVQLFNGFAPSIGDTFDILLASAVSGAFNNLILPTFNGLTFDVVVQSNLVRLTTAPVPLPAAAWLLLSGFLGVFLIARPRRASRMARDVRRRAPRP